jgi:hypothetical protein
MALVAEAVAVVANMALAVLEAGGEGNAQDHRRPPAAVGVDLPASVLDGPGAGEHRVDRPPVCPRRRGGPAGLACLSGGGDRHRPGPVGPLGGEPFGIQGSPGPGVSGRGGRHLRPGGVPTGPILRGPVAAAGAGPPDRHLGHRRRRDLRPGRHQRPARAGREEPDVGGRTALPGQPTTRRPAGGCRTRRAAHGAAGRIPLRRRRPHGPGP